MIQYLGWIISLISIVSMELHIRKRWYGWALSLGNQVLWIIYIVGMGAWGLLPLWAAVVIQAIRGMLKWYEEEHNGESETQAGDVG
jgi:type IV secretory pathway TrbL component